MGFKDKPQKREPGPKLKGRHCTDIPFLILIILVWCGMSVIAYFAFAGGNLDRLKYATDSEGNLCNQPAGPDSTRNLVGKQYLAFFNLSSTSAYTLCVESCPTSTLDPLNVICMYDVSPSTKVDENARRKENLLLVQAGVCSLTLESDPVLYHCVPKAVISAATAAGNKTSISSDGSVGLNIDGMGQNVALQFNARSTVQKIYQDVVRYWWAIAAVAGASFIISLFWLVLIQYLGGIMVWVTILGVTLVSCAVAAYLLYNYYSTVVLHNTLLSSGWGTLDSQLYNQNILLGLGIGFGVIALTLLLLVCFLFNRIRLAIAIIKEASKACVTMPTIYPFVLVQYLCLIILMLWFNLINTMISTCGNRIANGITSTANNISTSFDGTQIGNPSISNQTLQTGTIQYHSSRIDSNVVLQYMQIFYVFGFFWSYNFIVAIGQCTIAGAVATWYFKREKPKFMPLEILKSFSRIFFFHLGSMAFGSLILAIVQTIRFLLYKLQTSLAKKKESAIVNILCCCLQCILACFEKFVFFLNKNAYIEIAIGGRAFCSSAMHAFGLVVRNFIRLSVLNSVANFLIFITKIGIVCTSSIIGILLLTQIDGAQSSADGIASNWAFPLVFMVVFSWSFNFLI